MRSLCVNSVFSHLETKERGLLYNFLQLLKGPLESASIPKDLRRLPASHFETGKFYKKGLNISVSLRVFTIQGSIAEMRKRKCKLAKLLFKIPV